MEYVVMIGQFILSLSLLIVLHEFGHFLPAKWFKTKVEKFYLFFDPWFSLLKYKKGETTYGIGWLPLGGYVKIAGMVDESFDREQMEEEPKDWEFRSKPAWQRLIIMIGGVTVNFLLGFLIFAMVLSVWGEEYLPADQVQTGIYADSIGKEMGLQTGDHILKVGDQTFDKFNDRIIIRNVVLGEASTITVRREGEIKTISIDDRFIEVLSSSSFRNKALFMPRIPFKVQRTLKDYPADEAGLQDGDQILAVNGQSTEYYDQVVDIIERHPGESISLTYLRGGDSLQTQMTTTAEGQIGVYSYPPRHFFDTKRVTYGFLEAIPMGVYKGYRFIADQVIAFGQMFKGNINPSDSLGGFGTITSLFPSTWQWEAFWNVTAILSLILGFMNLLPIPALDGGHVMFLLYEVVTGRKPSDKFMEYATLLGFIIIIALVLYANGLDVLRWMNN